MKTSFPIQRVIYVALAVFFSAGVVHAQLDSLGGPYTPDQYTMLLMHFDNDLTNLGQSANGVGHGAPGTWFFVPNSSLPELSQCLYLLNDAINDTAYVTVADSSTLDMTGNWTIEGWINIFTFGTGSSDWRWVPRLVTKTGDAVFWRPNYFVEMWGSDRFFSCGYNVAGQDLWPQANSPNNTLVPGEWFHLTFIRDTSRHVIVTMVHDVQKQLLSYTSYTYDPILEDPPILTNQSVHIGYAGGGSTDSFLDGLVDEIRISNVIRNFPVPPLMSNVTILPNQVDTVSQYPIQVTAVAFTQGGTIQNVKIHFSDGSGWQEILMSPIGNDVYSGTTPGRPLGTVIRYFVSATDSYNLTATMPANADTISNHYVFGIYAPNTQTLRLPFDEGSGAPGDSSSYHNPVTVVRNLPSYSSDAKVGPYSIYFDQDSTFLEVNSPFLTSREFTVDFWFKADSMVQFTRLINKPTVPTTWFFNNYEIRFEPGQKISANFDDSTDIPEYRITLDSTLALQRWYHLIYEVSQTLSVLRLADSNDNVIQQKSLAVTVPPVLAQAPLRIANAHGRRHYKGRMDDIKIYNYPAMGLTGVREGPGQNLPTEFALLQNYPNPFNPSTTIRFTIPHRGHIRLVIYDLLGKEVKTLLNEELEAGEHSVTWDGKNEFGNIAASGVYFYRLASGTFISTRKIVFLR